MHDLLSQMGTENVPQETTHKPRERSRIWCYEDALDILAKNMV